MNVIADSGSVDKGLSYNEFVEEQGLTDDAEAVRDYTGYLIGRYPNVGHGAEDSDTAPTGEWPLVS